MLLGVKLAGIFGMLGCMEVVAMREMRMVRRRLMGLLTMVMGGAAMLLGRRFVVFCGLFVMLGQFGRVHCETSGLAGGTPGRI